MPSDCRESDIADAIRAWLDGPSEGMPESEYRRLIACQWEFCRTCARGFVEQFQGFEVEELASDYMILIKRAKHRPCPVPDFKTGLRRHMKHVLKQELNPAWAELRELLSEALWELERQGLAKCLGGTQPGIRKGQRNNTKFAEWVSVSVANAHNGQPPRAAGSAFSRKADALPHFYPRGATRWHASAPRVIAPENAGKLAAMLLDCADGWVAMEDLLVEFCKHVHLLEAVSEPDSTDDEEDQNEYVDRESAKQQSRERHLGLRHPATDDAFWELVSVLARKAWEQLRAEELTTIACQYLLANALLGRRAKLDEFGSHSTVFDKKKMALAIFRDVLAADNFLDPHSEISDWHDKLWAEVLRRLAHSSEFCNLSPEKTDSGAFN